MPGKPGRRVLNVFAFVIRLHYMQHILPVKCPRANVLIGKTRTALKCRFHNCEIFPIFNLSPFGYFAKNDLTNQQQTMNPVDELFLLRWNHIKLPSSVLQPPAEVEARDILWVMSAFSYAALVTTPRCRAHQSTRRRFTSFLMSTLRRGEKNKSDGGNRRHDHLVSRWS